MSQYSIFSRFGQLTLSVIKLVLSIIIFMLLVIFVVQTNESVVSKAKTFLLLGGENLDNVAKEIEYDSDMALASSMNHILSKFEFDSYKLLTEPDNLTCIVGKKVKANYAEANLCWSIKGPIILTRDIITSKGKRYLHLFYKMSFFKSSTSIMVIIIAISILLLCSSFYWFYKKIVEECLNPFFYIVGYIIEDDIRLVNNNIFEINKIYRSIEQHKKAIEFRAKNEVAIGLLHDVKQPYLLLEKKVKNTIKKISRKAKTEDVLEGLRTFQDDFSSQVYHLKKLAEDYKELNSELIKSNTTIESIIVEAMKACSQNYLSHRIQVRSNPIIFVDVLKIGRVFSNLIYNAIDASANRNVPVKFDIDINSDGPNLLVLFGSIGTYIEHPESIFSREKKSYGRGLGLYLVKSFIENHEGSITYLPHREGVFFKIALPYEQKERIQVEANNLRDR